jgi:hypothetical protein
MSTVLTLREVMDRKGLGPDARAFCEAVLKHGEVLAVTLGYLPETVLWLVTTPLQAQLMRDAQREAVVLTLGDAVDLAVSVGDPAPTSLWQVAVLLAAPAPEAPDDPPEDPDYPGDDPWEYES